MKKILKEALCKCVLRIRTRHGHGGVGWLCCDACAREVLRGVLCSCTSATGAEADEMLHAPIGDRSWMKKPGQQLPSYRVTEVLDWQEIHVTRWVNVPPPCARAF